MKKLIILALLTIGLSHLASAQKLGHANFEEIVGMLPERAGAEKEVQDLQKKLETRLNTMVETYQAKAAEFQQDTTLSTAMKSSLRSEIADMEKRIQEFQQTAYSEIEVKQNELLNVMLEKVRKAAQEVGKTNAFTYIFDSSNGSLLYAGGDDITGMIKTQLGI